MKRVGLIIFLLFCSFSGLIEIVNAQDDRLNDLVNQLKGGDCKYEFQGSSLINRSLFSFMTRRSDKEYCVIDAANALGMMGSQARIAVPDLIEALNNNHCILRDGILDVRLAIVSALGKIGDPTAIEPLTVLLSKKENCEGNCEENCNEFLHGEISEALGMFGEQARESVPYIVSTLKDSRQITTSCQAARALGQIKAPESIPMLIETLKTTPNSCVIESLEDFGPQAKEALPILNEVLQRDTHGIVPKEMFLNADLNGAVILEDLIKKGIIEEVSSTEVCLKQNVGTHMRRPQEIAGSNFNEIWNKLEMRLYFPLRMVIYKAMKEIIQK